MKKTKLLLVAVLSAFMIATLAGCAGSSGGGSSDDSSGGSGESGGSGGSGGKTSNGITTKNQSINPVIFDDSEVPEDYDERDTNYNTLYIILSDGTWEETQVHDWKTEIDEYYLTYTVKEGDDPEMTCTAAKKVYKKKLYDSQVSHLSGSDASEAQETYEDIVSSKKSSYETIYFVPSEKLMVFEHVYDNPGTPMTFSYHGKEAYISFLLEPTIKTNSERTKYKLTYNNGEIKYFKKL